MIRVHFLGKTYSSVRTNNGVLMVDKGVFVIWYRGGLSIVYKYIKNNPMTG